MSFGFLGCNPIETWNLAQDAPQLGTIGQAKGMVYVLVQANGAVAQGSLCTLDNGFEATEATKANVDIGHTLSVAQVAIPDDHYGWVLVLGDGIIRAGANVASAASIYTTSTAGRVDDSSSGQTRLQTITTLEAGGSSAGLVRFSVNAMFSQAQ